MTWPFPLRRRNWRDYVSAYVDGELEGADLAWFETQLAAVSDAADAVELERATTSLLSASLHQASAPRSFALTPEMLAAPRPAPARPAYDSARLFGRLTAGASIAAAVALAFVTVIDLSGGESGRDDTGMAAPGAPESMSATAAGDDPRAADSGVTGEGVADGVPKESDGPTPPEGGSNYLPGDDSGAAPADEDAARDTAFAQEDTQLATDDAGDDRGTGGWRAVQVILGFVLAASAGGYVFNRWTRER